MNNIYYLSHGGPGSGRYPWGSGDRPYQRLEKSRSTSSKARSGLSGYLQSRKARKIEAQKQKAKVEAQKRAVKEAEEKRKLEADKERVLREGSATEVLKYQGQLTNQELQTAFTRLNLEKQLANLSQKEMKSAMDKVDGVMKTIKVGTEWAKIGTDSYNAFARIYNATPEGQRKPLTLIGEKK